MVGVHFGWSRSDLTQMLPPPFSSLPRRPSPPLFPRQSCSKCRCVYYCGRDCQTDAWKDHKRECHTKGEPLKEPLYSNVHGVD